MKATLMLDTSDSSAKQIVLINNEMDIITFFQILLSYKKTIILTTLFSIVLSITIALSLTKMYKSTTILAPLDQNSDNNLSGISQSISAFTGASFGNNNNQEAWIVHLTHAKINQEVVISLALLNSEYYIKEFIKKYDLMPILMGVESWNENNNEINFNSDVYNPQTKKWVTESGKAPSLFKAVIKFKNLLKINQDNLTGLVTLSFEFPVPIYSQKWVSLIVSDVNEIMKERALQNAKLRISFLETQATQNSNIEIKNLIYQLIQQEIQISVLAETKKEYVLETISPPLIPEERSRPSRRIITIVGTLIGGFFALFLVFIQHKMSSRRKNIT